VKKYSEDAFFFEITSGPRTSDGQHIRYYLIRCCRCDRTASYHASGISNERMKKLFGRQGWYVGKSRNLHICPECQRKREHHIAEHGDESILLQAETPPKQPNPPSVALETAWKATDYLKRAEFCERHRREIHGYLQITAKYSGQDPQGGHVDWQHGTHIDSMPKEANEAAPVETQVVTVSKEQLIKEAVEAAPAEEPDEPADWWKELMEQK
jgi:hypothetical protein